jgi:FAD/FMN-containing dehydrogenase
MTDVMPRGIAQLDVTGLRGRMTGEIVTPSDAEWDVARQAWNLAVDQRPAIVALPETDQDVVEVVRYARANGLQVAPQGTGHNAHPLGDLANTVLLKMHRMTGVEVDPETRVARVRAGAVWIDVVSAAAPHGLASLAGSSPDVGVIGYTLGGGLSWLARRYGLGANRMLAAEVVTAEGEHIRVDRSHYPELFWALRGGGGSFAAVTSIEIELFPIPEVHAGILFFGIERASEVLHAWRDWVEDVPETVTSVGRLLRVPPLPEIPEPVRGRSFVVVETISLDGQAAADARLAPLRALGPEMDTHATVPVEALSHLHMDPDHPVPGEGDHRLVDIDHAGIDALLEVAGPQAETMLLSVELRHLGGAVGRATPDSGALASLDAQFAMFGVGMTMNEAMHAGVKADLARLMDATAPWDAGSAYLNFVEKREDSSRFFPEGAYDRLRAIKAQYDPEDTFRSNHPIPPAR